MTKIKGFSKLNKEARVDWVISNYLQDPKKSLRLLKSYWHSDDDVQKLHDEFVENTITNFFMPFGVAPNFLINGKDYCLPLVTEESSVVAAMSKAARFWSERGGFHSQVISTIKTGHVHFLWHGKEKELLSHFFEKIKPLFFSQTEHLTKNMVARGGGIVDVLLVDRSHLEPGYYQLKATFETCDSMGANFINSLLEEFIRIFLAEAEKSLDLIPNKIEIIMGILSNYTPDCLVRCEATCPVSYLPHDKNISSAQFAAKFLKAIRIAEIEPYRAVTHNKGIMNGVDALVIATGNDFRAIEAGVHAFAAKTGTYSSLSHAEINDDNFRFYMDIPLALGTIGGLTTLHPMAKFSLQLLGKPDARTLMMIIAAAGVSQNFSAIRSLITTGIQKGHMKMHLLNILNQLGASDLEKEKIIALFKNKVPSHSAVVKAFEEMKEGMQP
jgi:hydroxymethylglutaryl-CoA reductase